GAARDVGQELIDEFFGDVDHSLRELGIGDMGIPRRMKKLARMYYGRTVSYGDALDREDVAALASALARNVRPEAGEWHEAAALAAYVQSACRTLEGQDTDTICAGSIRFPSPQPD